MKSLLQSIRSRCAEALDGTALTCIRLWDRLRPPPVVKLVQDATGAVRLSAEAGISGQGPQRAIQGVRLGNENLSKLVQGSHAELLLQPHHFVFRSIEVPSRAADFLDGVVRAKLDSLAPWSAEEAAVGYGKPSKTDQSHIALSLAITARKLILPYAESLIAAGASAVKLAVQLPNAPVAPVTVLRMSADSEGQLGPARRILAGAILALLLVCVLSVAADILFRMQLNAQETEIARQIREQRLALNDAGGSDSLRKEIDRRKHTTPSSAVVLEVLARILPDNTYLKEIRIEGSKVQLTGLTQDASELIRLVEGTPHFSQATFFAPTTRAPGDTGDRFHIEAHINPVFDLGS